MIKLKEVFRLTYEARLSVRQIAACLSLSVGAISKYQQRAEAAGLGWPLPEDLSDKALQAILQPPRKTDTSSVQVEPDFEQMAAELTHKSMTRQLLWEEYASAYPDNHYSYTHYTVLFRQWRKKQQLNQPNTYEELGFIERLSLLVNSESTCRDNRKITRLLRQAKLRLHAQTADIDYQARRGLHKDTMAQLLQLDWVRHHRASRLFETLTMAHGDGSFGKLLTQLAKTDCLIIDDWGLDVLSQKQRNDLLEIMEDRHGRAQH